MEKGIKEGWLPEGKDKIHKEMATWSAITGGFSEEEELIFRVEPENDEQWQIFCEENPRFYPPAESEW